MAETITNNTGHPYQDIFDQRWGLLKYGDERTFHIPMGGRGFLKMLAYVSEHEAVMQSLRASKVGDVMETHSGNYRRLK